MRSAEGEIRAIMELEVRGIEGEAEAAAQFYETVAGYAPTLGIVGAATGLIQVMGTSTASNRWVPESPPHSWLADLRNPAGKPDFAKRV